MAKPVIKEEEQFAGGFIPKQLATRLGLMAVCQNKTRSAILRELLERSKLGRTPISNMVKIIAENAYRFWSKNEPLEDYEMRLLLTLQKKKIPQQYIDEILEEVGKLYHAKNKTK